MASTKRTSDESGEDDEQTSEASNPLFQQEDDAKRAKLSPLSDTTLNHLPNEILHCILVRVIAMEVKGLKMSKRVWKAKADLAISRLETVCSRWSSVVSTNYFRNELHGALDETAHETIRLEILHESPIQSAIRAMTTMKDEIFMLCKPGGQGCLINVYDRNKMKKVKDVIPLPGINPVCMAACNVSNCVYVGQRNKNCRHLSVLRISKYDQQFHISPWVGPTDYSQQVAPVSVTANGSVIILSEEQEEDSYLLSIYSASGSLQHEMLLYLSKDVDVFRCVFDVIQRSNGNLVLSSSDDRTCQRKLLEIDTSGNVVRQYQSALGGDSCVNFADTYGRIMITDPLGGMELLDVEFNVLDFAGPQKYEKKLRCHSYVHYNSERNEVMCISVTTGSSNNGLLTIFRFTEE